MVEPSNDVVRRLAKAMADAFTAAIAAHGAPAPVPLAASAVRISFAKSDVDLRLGVIYGKASAVRADHETDSIDIDDLEEAAVHFMEAVQKAGDPSCNDTHQFGDIPGYWVASWVDRDAGVWRVGFKPTDVAVAKAAYNGEFVGFSIEGFADRVSDPIGRTTIEVG